MVRRGLGILVWALANKYFCGERKEQTGAKPTRAVNVGSRRGERAWIGDGRWVNARRCALLRLRKKKKRRKRKAEAIVG